MDKDIKIIIIFAICIFVLLSIIVVSQEINDNKENKILNKIIYKELEGQEAVQYCIENYGNMVMDFDYKIPKRCYSLVNTRNTLN